MGLQPKKAVSMRERGVVVLLIALLIALVNPFGSWMPQTILTMTTVGLVVLFAVFAGFVWKERARDERELLHGMLAGRVAFLTGTGTLIVGIVIQSFRHTLDVWLVVVLVVMILSKIIGIAMINENLAASSRFNPRPIDAIIVIPDLEVPGMKAKT